MRGLAILCMAALHAGSLYVVSHVEGFSPLGGFVFGAVVTLCSVGILLGVWALGIAWGSASKAAAKDVVAARKKGGSNG